MTEPTDKNVLQELVADPQRQAHDKIRGFVYQVWQSVLAWIDLGEDEILALEGGEDFDILGLEEAEVNQVKDLARNVTLRSEDAVESIGNFWDLKEKNKGRRITFRFLTTAQAGIEMGSPFGEGLSGIEHWRRAAQMGSGIDQLRALLLERTKLPETLLEFLRTASDEEIRTELLQPFEWWLGLESTAGIKMAVQRKLISYGEKKGIPAYDSRKAVPYLLDAAFEAACQKDRRLLYRSDFVEIFDEATSKRLNSAEALAAAAMFPQLLSLLPGGAQPPVSLGSYSSISAPPPLPPRLAPREKLVARYSNVLAGTGGLVLAGSTGMGKSTLAKLLSGPYWLWANLRSEQNAKPSAVLAQLAFQLHTLEGPGPEGVVLDDYSPETPDENFLANLLHTLRARDIRFILTTSKPLPSRLAANIGLQASSFQVPGLSRSEVEDWLGACGCPPDLLAEQAGFLAALTSGHPQLLHARIEHRLRTGWREIEPEDLIETPGDVAQVRMEARELLRGLPEETRALAYRLSLAAQPFRRDHALAISQHPPQVPLPGEFFDALIGPWIEQVTDRYFRISPLLSGEARNVLPAGELTALHQSWGRTLLKTPPLSHTEAIGSFFHAFMGKDLQTLIEVTYALLNSREAVQKVAFSSLHWFASIGIEGPMPDFIPASERRLSLRVLQYRIVDEPALKRNVAEVWDEESRTLPLESEDRRPAYRYLFLLSVFMDRETRHESSRLFAWLQEVVNLERDIRLLYPELAENLERSQREQDLGDPTAAFLLPIVVQCGSMDDLSAFLDGLDRLEEQSRGRILKLFTAFPDAATSLIDRCWLAERDATPPDWGRCLAVLERAKSLGRAWGCGNLRKAAARGKILVWNETGTSTALDALAGEEIDLRRSALLLDLQATLLQDRNEHEAALRIWQDEIPRWIEQEELGEANLVYAYRKAAISFGYLGQWPEAARLFREAFTRLDDYFQRHPAEPRELEIAPVELLVDYAFSLWRAGKKEASFESFATAISKISALIAVTRETDRYKFLTKTLATMLRWLVEPSDAVEPFPGAASSDKNPEGIQGLPPTKTEHLWALLCWLDLKAGSRSKVLDQAREALPSSADSVTWRMVRRAEVGRMLRSGDFENLLPSILALAELLCEGRELTPRHCTSGLLFFALVSFSAHRPNTAPPFSEWLSTVERAFPQDDNAVRLWFQTADEAFRLTAGEMMGVLKSMGKDPRFPFCAARAAASNLPPEATLTAQLSLVLSVESQGFSEVVGYLASDVVETQWRRLANSPALLVSPRLNVPAIREACDLEELGIRKAAAILLAAAPAVQVHLAEPQRQALMALALE